MDFKDLRRQYEELKIKSEDLGNNLNEIRKGHLHIHSKYINIDYDLPDDVKGFHHWINRFYIWLGASLLGLAAIGFSLLADEALVVFNFVFHEKPVAALALIPFGILLCRYLTDTYFKGAEGSGIPQVVASLQMELEGRKRLLNMRVGIGKILGTSMGLLFGASSGREGPSVHVGAIIFRYFSQYLKVPFIYTRKSLILAGGAAGVSAAFNTPIAGIVFAIEELGRSFYEKETSVLMMAIVVSGLTALSISGEYYYFGTATVNIIGVERIWSIPIGMVTGFAGGLFSLILLKGTEQMRSLSKRKRYAYVFLFGVMISIIGYLSGGASFGTGYEEAKLLLQGGEVTSYFAVSKIFATFFTYFSGIPGGIFSPTLSIGAGIGDWLSAYLNPSLHQAWVLFGMVGFFSGVIRSPITSVIIVSEMTNNHSLLFPLLLTSVVSYGTSRILSKDSLYHRMAEVYLDEDKKFTKASLK